MSYNKSIEEKIQLVYDAIKENGMVDIGLASVLDV